MSQKMKIMAAVDLSGFSSMIVNYGVWLSGKMDAELSLINVINERDLYMVQRVMVDYDTFSYPEYLIQQEQSRIRKLTDLFEAASPGIRKCRCLVRTGVPHRELLGAIENEKPQLMVVGTKGRSNLADVVVGSTARKLYRQSPVPLLSIPADFKEFPEG